MYSDWEKIFNKGVLVGGKLIRHYVYYKSDYRSLLIRMRCLSDAAQKTYIDWCHCRNVFHFLNYNEIDYDSVSIRYYDDHQNIMVMDKRDKATYYRVDYNV